LSILAAPLFGRSELPVFSDSGTNVTPISLIAPRDRYGSSRSRRIESNIRSQLAIGTEGLLELNFSQARGTSARRVMRAAAAQW
jgi:hypothetical protein